MSTMTLSTTTPSTTPSHPPRLRVVPAAPGGGGRDRVAPTANRRPGLRLTRRGRVVVTALAIGLALAVGSVAQRAAATTPGQAVEVTAYTVTAGETLWRIASAITEPGADVRDTVDRLMELNGLTASGLQAGQQLLLPAS